MPFYIRKAISLGPLRFNLSKSGIGVSVGVKGLRIGSGARGNYVHAGRFGLYYRKGVPGGPVPTANLFKSILAERASAKSEYIESPSGIAPSLQEIESGNALQMVDTTSENLLREINEKRSNLNLWPWFLGTTCVLTYVVSLSTAPSWAWIVVVVGGGLATFWRYERDQIERSIVVMYDVEEEVKTPLDALYSTFEKLADARAVWHVQAEQTTSDGRSGQSFASRVVRSKISPTIGSGPVHLRTNIPVPKIPVGRQTLHFLPDRILVEAPEGYGAVQYSDLVVSVEQERVVEDGNPPANAQVVGRTWAYVTQSGEQDRRFKYNRELPIVLYERVHLKSSSGLNELLQISVPGLGEELKQALVNLDLQPPTKDHSHAAGSASGQALALSRSDATPREAERVNGFETPGLRN